MTHYLDTPIEIDAPATASIFDDLSHWASRFGAILLDNIPIRTGIDALDVGCGTGFPLFELAGMLGPSSRVVGVDIWRGGLERARWKLEGHALENVRIVETDATAMPFDDESFDLIVSNLGVNNFADPHGALRECHRVIRPEGTLAITTNVRGHMTEFYQVVRDVLVEMNREDRLDAVEESEAHRGTTASHTETLHAAGFAPRATIEKSFVLRFADGASVMNNFLIRIGFMDGWKRMIGTRDEREIFTEIERRLDEIAGANGEIRFTIPMVYIECGKS